MALTGRELGAVALGLTLALPALVWLSMQYGAQYTEFWLPAYRAALELMLPDYDVLSLEITAPRGEYLIAGTFRPERILVVHDRVLPAEFTVDASTLMAHALKHPIILLSAVLAWPGLSLATRGMRLLISLPFLGLLELLDIPLVLSSAVTDMVSWQVSPAADAASKLVDWSGILDGGGRIALCLAAAVVCAWLHERWMRRNPLLHPLDKGGGAQRRGISPP